MKFKHLVLVPLAAVLFNACSDIPECSDEKVQNSLTEHILDRRYGKLPEMDRKKLKFTYKSFMSGETDEDSKTRYCKAKVSIKGFLNEKPHNESAFIEYSARYTDDKKEAFTTLLRYDN